MRFDCCDHRARLVGNADRAQSERRVRFDGRRTGGDAEAHSRGPISRRRSSTLIDSVPAKPTAPEADRAIKELTGGDGLPAAVKLYQSLLVAGSK